MNKEEKNYHTLKEYLDIIGVHSGDDRGFVLIEGLFSSTRMEVSRRYIEAESYEYLLDRKMLSVSNTTNVYGQETILIIVDDH